MDGQALVGAGGAATNPTSSVGARTNILNGPLKRRRSETTGVLDSSPSSIIDDEHSHHHEHERKRQPGVKRACNECRQQKVSVKEVDSFVFFFVFVFSLAAMVDLSCFCLVVVALMSRLTEAIL